MLKNAKKTKIVCTLGPASDSEEVLTQLVENGLNVCRFNFSHGSHEEQKARMDTAKKVREKLTMEKVEYVKVPYIAINGLIKTILNHDALLK